MAASSSLSPLRLLLPCLLCIVQDKKLLNALVPPKVPLPEFEISLNRRLAEEIGQHP
jgi:hypothetical protein